MNAADRHRGFVRGLASFAVSGLCLVLANPVGLAGAQAGPPTKASELELISSSVVGRQTIRLVVAAPPSFDQVDLRPESFAVTVGNATSPASISRDTQPVDVILAVDTSGSMKGEAIDAARRAAGGFLLGVPAGSRVGVVAFSDTARVAAPLDPNPATAAAALEQLQADGETAMYDSVSLATRQFDQPDRRRSIVLLSDGGDTVSAASLDDAVAAVTTSGSSLYSIALATSETNLGALDQLVSRTNGSTISVSDTSALAAAYSNVMVSITNRYVIDVTSSARGRVPISVSVAQDGRLATVASVEALGSMTPGSTPGAAASTAALAAETPQSTWIDRFGLWLGIAAVFIGIVAVAGVVLRPGAPRATRVSLRSRAKPSDLSVRPLVQSLAGAVETGLDRGERRAVLDRALDDAAIDMRPGEFVVGLVAVASVLALVAWTVWGLLISTLVWFGVLIIGRAVVRSRGRARRLEFLEGLDAALVTLAGGLRAGYALPQAIDAVAREADGPISEEFARVVMENRLGRDIVESLRSVEKRVGKGDFSWVVKAISIQRELGGDLAEIMDNVAATIRDRNRVRAQVRALSAEGRFSAIVLFSLPIAVIAGVALFSPKYLEGVTDGLLGWIIIVTTAAMLLIGGLWMRTIIRIRF